RRRCDPDKRSFTTTALGPAPRVTHAQSPYCFGQYYARCDMLIGAATLQYKPEPQHVEFKITPAHQCEGYPCSTSANSPETGVRGLPICSPEDLIRRSKGVQAAVRA